ncbi:hypothetical protein HK102_010933, partial [Quaeritorhiza haematococci]
VDERPVKLGLTPVNLEVKYPFIKSLIVDASFTPDEHTHYNSAMLLYHLSNRSFDMVRRYLEEGGRVDYFENFGMRRTLGQYVQRFEDDARCCETLLLIFKLNFLDRHALNQLIDLALELGRRKL